MQGNVGVGKAPECALDVSGAIQSSVGTSSTTYKNFYGKVPPTNVYPSTITPNTTNATSSTWPNNNVTWTSSASSVNGTNYSYFAFDNSNGGTTTKWESANSLYTSGTANSSAALTAVIGQTSQRGEWVQIQSSIPVVMTSYSLASADIPARLPKTFWIVGSNDGITWYLIQTASCGATQYSSTSYTTSSTFLVNSASAQTSGSATVTTTINAPYTTAAFTYFRVIFLSLFSTSETLCDIGEFFINFSPSTQTGPSRALVYMDPSNINQLDVSGSLALINSSPTAITVTPNTPAADITEWVNNGIRWLASASSYYMNTGWGPHKAFNNSDNGSWHDDTTGYTAATGVANTAFQTTVYTTGSSGGTSVYNGQWLQIKSSVGLSMKTFYFLGRDIVYGTRLPQVFYIVGSNTGTGTWTPIFKGDTASTTGASISATVSLTELGSSGTISNFYGSTSLTYTTYGNLASSFIYFRLVVSEICGNDITCNIGDWGLTFTPAASSVSLALDNATLNQLNIGGAMNVGGSLGIIDQLYFNYVSNPTLSTTSLGYFFEGVGSTSPATNAGITASTISSLPIGVYILSFIVGYSVGGTAGQYVQITIGTTATTGNEIQGLIFTQYNGSYVSSSGTVCYNNTSAKSIYLNCSTSSSNISIYNRKFQAIRIA
jgi:hypothetical protein